MEIIPAIDIIDGKCVRLTKGDYGTKKIYPGSPVEIAKTFEGYGLTRLHVVDLDGARSGSPKNLKILERIAGETSMRIQFGGGVKSSESLENVLNAGAAKVICGTIGLMEPEKIREWIKKYSVDKIIAGTDYRAGKIAVSGWERQTEIPFSEAVEGLYAYGIREIVATDISRDGMLCGVDKTIYYSIKEKFPLLKVIVSGGISSIRDIETLDSEKIEGVIVGKAIYEGKIKPEELRRWCLKG